MTAVIDARGLLCPLPVKFGKTLSGQKHLAPHLQFLRWQLILPGLQLQGYAAHCFQLRSNVLANQAVPTGGARHQHPFLID